MASLTQISGLLSGQCVAFTGRLVSMSRREAALLVAAHGGACTSSLARSATMLVVGSDGWPLGADGRPTRRLRLARALVRRGKTLSIVSEQELLDGLRGNEARAAALYTLPQLADILHLPGERLRAWVRAGLIRPVAAPGPIQAFDYGQVARAKSLSDLLRAGVSSARLRQSLVELRRWLGDPAEALTQLAMLEDFGQLVVRLDNGALAEPGGQLRFEFPEAPNAADEPELRVCALPSNEPTAEEWFEQGCEAEERGDLTAALAAYRQTLLVGGPATEPCFNLANVLYALGKRSAAAERFRQAIELEPSFADAWNNLGTVLAELNELDEAVAAYRSALAADPHFVDAHFNLADTLEDQGRLAEAREHWQAYLRYEPHGEWADFARGRLKGACSPADR